jgi:glycerol-3-phosphate O-acyltransferase
MRPKDQANVRAEVTHRLIERISTSTERDHVLHVIQDTLYHERLRLEKRPQSSRNEEQRFWSTVSQQILDATPTRQNALLRSIIEGFLDEIVGHFDPQMYKLATRMAPTAMAGLLNSLDWKRIASNPREALDLRQNLLVKGEVETVRKLAEEGTLVVVPTHVSNLDSIVLGYAAHLMNLPALTYGAGLNLFSHRILGFFMNRLGAYKVDRLKTASLYKDTLKEFATRSIELSYHNLFFPGGTRIRSGRVERKLKLGLLGTALQAYMNNLRAGSPRPNVFVVPCTISYGLVLEAETLIEDHLKDTGKSRYIISDDEFSKPRKVAHFLRSLVQMESPIYITFGSPMDPFGNRVDFQGRSRDRRDREIDIRGYVCRNDDVVNDPQRDREFTKGLAESVIQEFSRCNRVQSTNVVAYAFFKLMRQHNPGVDVYRLLRIAQDQPGYPRTDVLHALDEVLQELRELARSDRIRLAPDLEIGDASTTLQQALTVFGEYHHHKPIRARNDRVRTEHPQLVYYYQNRLDGYGLVP